MLETLNEPQAPTLRFQLTPTLPVCGYQSVYAERLVIILSQIFLILRPRRFAPVVWRYCGRAELNYIVTRDCLDQTGLETLNNQNMRLPMRMQDEEGNDGGDTGTGVVTRTRTKTKKPSLYRVLLLNDDFTPMEFVIMILEKFFSKSREQATQIMLHVHNNGVGECGIYTYEVAETKVTQVMDFAQKNQHPLQCVMEKK